MNETPSEPLHERLIEWTGERCVPWTGDHQVVYEHYHRYLVAQRFVDGRRVLDLASGEGYGSALLSQRAAHVTGLEIDAATVAHSRTVYSANNLEFVEGSMLDLSRFPDGSFDVVTCFEALEHVVEHDQLLAGVSRVLSDDGVFLTSTPDRLIYNEALHQHNPHHVRELSHDEFDELLTRYFEHVRIWGQAVAVGSVFMPVGEAPAVRSEVLALAPSGDAWVQQERYVPTYYVAVASRRELPPVVDLSLLVDVELTLVRSAQRRAGEQADAVAGHDARVREIQDGYEAQIASMAAEQRELAAHLVTLDARDEQARARLIELEQENAALRARVLSLES